MMLWWYHRPNLLRTPCVWPWVLFTFLGLLPSWTLCYSTTPIPITVLSGFLGSGKTTLLQNLLQNKDGLRIAIIVNDVASVNIDSKLVANEANAAAGMVELQNGCACCSQAEELLASVAELVTLSDLRADDEAFDHIVIECSGVADPKGIRAKFQQAALYQMPLLERVELDTMVTVVDAASYLEYLESEKIASPDETPELYYPNGEAPDFEDEDLDDDTVPPALRALLRPNNQPLSSDESVAALLISQTETADVVLLNKVDLATPERLQRIESVVRACCPSEARIHRTTYAKVPWRDILGVAQGRGVVMSGVVDDHREAVKSATLPVEHSHSHAHASSTTDDHPHSHEHAPAATEHSHDHNHGCDDPGCTDPSHQHGTTTYAGIAAMVYQARRPFHPGRLTAFLRQLPIRMGLPPSKQDAIVDPHPILSQVVRSKGFCWCADSHKVAYYWSQAGPSFELSKVGAWWDTLPREQWPLSATESILADFDGESSDRSVGDRRQEVVLIGSSLQSLENQATVREALDECLLKDAEWEEYWANRDQEDTLSSKFPTPLFSRLMSY